MKKFGGEPRGLMEVKKMNELKLPILVDTLFDNHQLELTRILCILSCFPKNKKGITFSALIYYYALSVSEIELEKDEEQNDLRYNVVNLYIDFQSKIKQLSILLANLDYIEVIGEVKVESSEIRVKMKPEGFELVSEMKNEYFVKLINNIEFIKNNFAYTKSIEQKLLERGRL